MSRTFGLVLAGGRGTRLGGVRKATLRIGGISLLHRTLGAFEGQVEAVLVASGQGAEAGGPLLHLRDARLEPDPRRAVIAAYATMEQMLAAQGVPRRAVEAPLEYMARLFAASDVSREALRTLTDLFELARFSQHPISPATKERAIAALTVIEQELHVT